MSDLAPPPSIAYLFLITGTTRGIGKALVAEALKRPDSFVVSLSRSDAFLWKNRQNIPVDLDDSGQIGPALDSVHFNFSKCRHLKQTILINNAGVLDPIAPISDGNDALIARNIRVNLTAPLVLARHFYRFSKPFQGPKWIVNITSGASQTPYYGWSAYCAAKAGLDMATRVMALEFARIDTAFHICAVAPGTVDTDMQDRIRRCSTDQFERVDKFKALKARGGLQSPGRVAAELIGLLLKERFQNGGRHDLREMAADELAAERT